MSPCSDVSYKIADQWFVETKMDASSDLTEERVNVIVTGDDVSEEDDRGEVSLSRCTHKFESCCSDSGGCCHRRNGSGSFQGPEESDDEIQFGGCRRNSSRDDVSLNGYHR